MKVVLCYDTGFEQTERQLQELLQEHFPEYECEVIVVDGPDPGLVKETFSIAQRLVDSLNECKYEVVYLPDQLNKDFFRPPYNMHPVNKKLFKKVFTRRIDRRGRKPNRKVNLYN